MSEPLKSCPFCGGKAEYKTCCSVQPYIPHWVKCVECGAEWPIRGTKKKAIEAWNRRDNRGPDDKGKV